MLYLTQCAMGLLAALLWVNCGASVRAAQAEDQAVRLEETGDFFLLQNGTLSARIEKRTGNLASLRYRGLELLAVGSRGSEGGYWSSVGRSRSEGQWGSLVTADPSRNRGELAEVAVRFQNAAGADPSPIDVEYRYTLKRGESWIYVWSILNRRPGYPPFSVGEARYCVKLNPDIFDWMTIDAARSDLMPSGRDWDNGTPLNVKEARRMVTGARKGKAEHKYSYSAVLAETPAYGWSSTSRDLGLWLINPSLEYIAGGPTKAELTAHLDVNPGGLPTLLNMWIGSHYGGTVLSIGSDESWTKVVGPFLLYCNSGLESGERSRAVDSAKGSRQDAAQARSQAQFALWQDAVRRAESESRRWPYQWAKHDAYPLTAERGTVSGRLVLRDAFDPDEVPTNVWVGVTGPDYLPPARGWGGVGRRSGVTNPPAFGPAFPGLSQYAFRGGFGPQVDWQRDGKFYQYWVRADSQGRFEVPNVREGNYWLRAIAENVLGEFTMTNIVVSPGKKDLGTLTWSPRRFGRKVWEIGRPDRTAREFRHGNDYWHWGTFFLYPQEFPNDVNFVIGKSDPARDWNFVHPPRLIKPVERDAADFPEELLNRSNVRSVPWTIRFRFSDAPPAKAVLRLAFCGSHAGCRVVVEVNGTHVGDTGLLPSTSAMQREGVRAYWVERNLPFEGKLLKNGNNEIRLLSEADSWAQGVSYDYIRLEVE